MQRKPQIETIKHSLDLDERLPHKIKGWKAQRLCSIIVLVVIGLTALGLFGGGPLSWREVKKPGIALQYEVFNRVDNEMDIGLQVRTRRPLEVALPMRYLDHFKVEKIVPDAYKSSISQGYVRYHFNGVSEGETIVRFFLSPKDVGTIEGVCQVDQQHFELTHFIYP